MKTVIIGFLAGYFSGHFGLGGGLITTPAIRLILGYPSFIAVGTPLLVNIPTALSGAVSYGQKGYVDRQIILPLAASGVLGAIGGSFITGFFSGSFILLLTAMTIFILSFRFIRRESPGKRAIAKISNRALAFAGAVIGIFSGFLGLGGGFLLIPFIHLILGRDIKTTFGTSLVIVTAITFPGAVVHYFLGHVNLGLAFLLILGVIPGAILGARVAILLPTQFLRIFFGLLLMGLALYLGYFELLQLVS